VTATLRCAIDNMRRKQIGAGGLRHCLEMRHGGATMRTIFYLALALVLLAARPVFSQEGPRLQSNADLMRWCGSFVSDTTHVGGGFCLGYMKGVMDSLSVSPAKSICLPDVTTGQLARVYMKWADANPERLHESMYLGVLESLVQAFPCGLAAPAPVGAEE
jgi:hypothetical protein